MGSLGGKGLECKLTLADCILAILSAGAPDLVPFMADEAIMAIPDMGEINYNLQFYMKFLEKVSKVEEQLKKKGNFYYTACYTYIPKGTIHLVCTLNFHNFQPPSPSVRYRTLLRSSPLCVQFSIQSPRVLYPPPRCVLFKSM